MEDFEQTLLWKTAFDHRKDGLDDQRDLIAHAYRHFRSRVALLLQQIQRELPSLTLHDITHVDSLWRVASEIAGPNYSLNPVEALVLGGSFLLHDAAHCRAAFTNGIEEIRKTNEWKDTAAQRGLDDEKLIEGSNEFQSVLFETLRVLHPTRARSLPFAFWSDGDLGTPMHLFPHDELRNAYGDVIGEIAQSHWSHPHELESFAKRTISAPTCLTPAAWTLNMLKIAVLLRVADAAHIDEKRAPRFLILLNKPTGISRQHWLFQARLRQPHCDVNRQELLITGMPFPVEEQEAWWLAYDTARLVSRELEAADDLLRDHNLPRLAAREVAGIKRASTFALHVPAEGWYPVDTNIKITDVKTMVKRFGGAQLYGNKPHLALRELLQNAVDAIHACRKLDGLSNEEGEIEVALENGQDKAWLHITDTGIGMSRYVLTEVLLDFGRSLWRSNDLKGEWKGLSASGFEAIGQFGIGFFSIFMLSERVRLVTRRYETKDYESSQWLLDFFEGVDSRPVLREPINDERLKRHGTRISLLVGKDKLSHMLESSKWDAHKQYTLAELCGKLAPAIDINLFVRSETEGRQKVIGANDWITMEPINLLRRIEPRHASYIQHNNSGPWRHMSELRSANGNLVGRIALQAHGTYSGKGVGVVKGILAGDIPGVAGIVSSKPQKDLARHTAIPEISASELQQWTEAQKEILLQQGEVDSEESAQLFLFGATYKDLVLGQLGSEFITYDELPTKVKELESLIIHDGEITHEHEEDISESDFQDGLKIEHNVLELAETSRPDWLEEITDISEWEKTYSNNAALQDALKKVWKEIDVKRSFVIVGRVYGSAITRHCIIMTPKES